MRAMAARVRYERLATERVNPRSARLDRLGARAIVTLMNREDRVAVAAVGRVAPAIAAAVDTIVAALAAGGRLFFVGAGTSGRLGVLEAAECPPTFGTRPGLVQAIMAGGRRSVFRSREGAEDDARAAARTVRRPMRLRPEPYPMSRALSQITLMSRGMPREYCHTAAAARFVNRRLPRCSTGCGPGRGSSRYWARRGRERPLYSATSWGNSTTRSGLFVF